MYEKVVLRNGGGGIQMHSNNRCAWALDYKTNDFICLLLMLLKSIILCIINMVLKG